MPNYDDFSASDIFVKDDDGNFLYKRKDKYYIINDKEKREKLQEIEGYRYFIFGSNTRPIALFLSVMFVGYPLAVLIKLLFFSDIDEKSLAFFTGFGIYLIILYIYNKKIENILENTSTIKYTKNEPQKTIKSKKFTPYRFTLKNLKSSLPDMNIFHILSFLIIASPFLLVLYYWIKIIFSNNF